MKITGNTVGTTMPRSNWNQTDPKKADYIKGKEAVDESIQKAQNTADKAKADVNSHGGNKENPHDVTAEQIGAAPSDHKHSAEDVGAVTEDRVNTMIKDALGVIENAYY